MPGRDPNPYEAPDSDHDEGRAGPTPQSDRDVFMQIADILGGLFWTAVGSYLVFCNAHNLPRILAGRRPDYLFGLVYMAVPMLLFSAFLLVRAARRARNTTRS